jgi:hypothetical protein
MMFEFRFYEVTPGRLAQEVARMYEVAIRDVDGTGRSLFEQHGIARPLGAWTAIAGKRLPVFGYLLVWDSLAERDASFPSFWADPRWTAVRARTEDGHPMVEHIDDWLIVPSPAWDRTAGRRSLPAGGVHELRIHHCMAGHAGEVTRYLAEIEHAQLEVRGATVIGMFDVLIGPNMPAIVSFLAWPDFESQQSALARLDVEPRVHARRRDWAQRLGFSPIREVEQTLLRPLSYGVPVENFGIRP